MTGVCVCFCGIVASERMVLPNSERMECAGRALWAKVLKKQLLLNYNKYDSYHN